MIRKNRFFLLALVLLTLLLCAAADSIDDLTWDAAIDKSRPSVLILAISSSQKGSLPRTDFVVDFFGAHRKLGHEIYTLGPYKLSAAGVYRFEAAVPGKYASAVRAQPVKAVSEPLPISADALQSKPDGPSHDLIGAAAEETEKSKSKPEWQSDLEALWAKQALDYQASCTWGNSPSVSKRCVEQALGNEPFWKSEDVDPKCAAPLAPVDLVQKAGVIVLATAAKSHNSQIVFDSKELLRGTLSQPQFDLEGSLSPADDFNHSNVPYALSRVSMSCFAKEYKQGAMYLLFLNNDSADPNVYWAPSSPTNEEVKDKHDPWVEWVRQQLGHQLAK